RACSLAARAPVSPSTDTSSLPVLRSPAEPRSTEPSAEDAAEELDATRATAPLATCNVVPSVKVMSKEDGPLRTVFWNWKARFDVLPAPIERSPVVPLFSVTVAPDEVHATPAVPGSKTTFPASRTLINLPLAEGQFSVTCLRVTTVEPLLVSGTVTFL